MLKRGRCTLLVRPLVFGPWTGVRTPFGRGAFSRTLSSGSPAPFEEEQIVEAGPQCGWPLQGRVCTDASGLWGEDARSLRVGIAAACVDSAGRKALSLPGRDQRVGAGEIAAACLALRFCAPWWWSRTLRPWLMAGSAAEPTVFPLIGPTLFGGGGFGARSRILGLGPFMWSRSLVTPPWPWSKSVRFLRGTGRATRLPMRRLAWRRSPTPCPERFALGS